MVAQPSWKANLGIAKEAVAGTPVAPTAFIPIGPFSPKRVPTLLEDKSWTGSAVDQRGQQLGLWHSELEIPGDVYPDTIGWFLASLFGAVLFTPNSPAAGVNTHNFSVLNTGTQQPPTKTLTDFYVANARAYPLSVCTELSFKFTADGKLTYSSKWSSKAEAAAATPVPAYTTVPLLAGWRCVPSILGAAPKVIDAEFNLKRTSVDYVPANNSQDPAEIFVGPLAVDGKVNLVMEDDVYYNHFTANDQGSLSLTFAQGAGATQTSIGMGAALAAFTEGPIDRSGPFVKLPLSFVGLGNVTNAVASAGLSPASVGIVNAVATGVYL